MNDAKKIRVYGGTIVGYKTFVKLGDKWVNPITKERFTSIEEIKKAYKTTDVVIVERTEKVVS